MDTIQKKRALIASIMLGLFVAMLGPSTAFADVPVDVVARHGVRISAQLVSLIVGAFIPLLTSMLTNWKSKNAGFITIILNIANGLLTVGLLSDGTAVISQEAFFNAVPGLVASFFTYYGIYKPHAITSAPVQVPGDSPGTTLTIPGKLSNKGLVRA